MIPLFLGLSLANLLLLSSVFGLGLFATDTGHTPTSVFTLHITLGIAAGLMATLTHLAVYTYFMATSKWLHAASAKADLDTNFFVLRAYGHKRRALMICLGSISVTILTMFAGAASDPTLSIEWWPRGGHLAMAMLTLGVNAAAAIGQFGLIRLQGSLMDQALAILNSSHPTPAPYTQVRPV